MGEFEEWFSKQNWFGWSPWEVARAAVTWQREQIAKSLVNVPRKLRTYLNLYPDDKELAWMLSRIEVLVRAESKQDVEEKPRHSSLCGRFNDTYYCADDCPIKNGFPLSDRAKHAQNIVTYQKPGPDCPKCHSWPCGCGGPLDVEQENIEAQVAPVARASDGQESRGSLSPSNEARKGAEAQDLSVLKPKQDCDCTDTGYRHPVGKGPACASECTDCAAATERTGRFQQCPDHWDDEPGDQGRIAAHVPSSNNGVWCAACHRPLKDPVHIRQENS